VSLVRRIVAIVGAVVLTAALAIPARAAKSPGGNAPFAFRIDHQGRAGVVEQESPNYLTYGCFRDPTIPGCDPSTWIYNVTDCDWDVDDYTQIIGQDVISGGTSVSTSTCVMADGFDNFSGDNHYVELTVDAAKPLGLTFTSSRGLSWNPVPQAIQNGVEYHLCLQDTSPSPYPVVEGSNGGTGFGVVYALTLTAGRAAARSVFALLRTGFPGTGFWASTCNWNFAVTE
jgi:hypothetical protein